MIKSEHEKFRIWRNKLIKTMDISPLNFGMSQEDVISIFGQPDATSTMIKNNHPLIFKYQDIEFHFDECHNHTLFLIYSDYKIDLSIMMENMK